MNAHPTSTHDDYHVEFTQVVGCTIDAGAKIYAGRVDAVHGDILQMLGTMGNAEADNEEGIYLSYRVIHPIDRHPLRSGYQQRGQFRWDQRCVERCTKLTNYAFLSDVNNSTYW